MTLSKLRNWIDNCSPDMFLFLGALTSSLTIVANGIFAVAVWFTIDLWPLAHGWVAAGLVFLWFLAATELIKNAVKTVVFLRKLDRGYHERLAVWRDR